MKKKLFIWALIGFLFLTSCGETQETAVTESSTATENNAGSQETITEAEAATSEQTAVVEDETETPVVETVVQITFSGRLPGEQDDIYVMDSMGRNLVNLTNSPQDDNSPAWSPDGTQIAWSVEVGEGLSEIYIMDDDGANKRELTDLGLDAGTPTWSPDGLQIAFWAGAQGERDIYVINVDGSGVEMLTAEPGDETSPHWSPDGTKIAFTYSTNEGDDIYMVDASSGALTQLTDTELNERVAKWSPDGTELAFFAELDDQSEVFLMAADGSNVRQLTDQAGEDYFPTWSPDGRFLLYLSRPAATREFHLLDLTTMTLQRLPVENGVEAGLASVQPVGNSLVAFGGEEIENMVMRDAGEETMTVSGDSIIATLALTEVQYLTDSFLGPQTDESIYAGNCIARLLNNGQLVLYGDNSFEFIPVNLAGMTDCLMLDDNTSLSGSYQMDDNGFTVDYNFSELLMVLKEDFVLETSVSGFVSERLPSGDFRGGFGFDIRSSGDFGSGDVLYLADEDLLAGAEPDGEAVPPIEIVYSVTDALAGFDAPILAPPPPDFIANATENRLSFGSASQLPAAEAVSLYKGYMSGLGWVVSQESTEGNTVTLAFSRDAEHATIWVRSGLATVVYGSFDLFGEPWTAVPQVPLLEDAQLSTFRYSQNYDLPAATNLDDLVQYYQTTINNELASAGWTFESSSGSETRKGVSWSRPGGRSSASISDVASQNRVGVTINYAYTEPALTGIELAMSDVGLGQLETLAEQFKFQSMAINESQVNEAAAVSAFCEGTVHVISGSPALAAAARQACPEGLVEFTVAQVPLAIVINQENDWARSMTTAEAVAALTTAQTWADVNPSWPDSPIVRAVPTTGTAVYDMLVNELLGGDAASLSSASNLFQYDTGFGVVWNVVSQVPEAVGFAPIDDVLEYADDVAAVQLDGNTTADDAYLLQLPLMLITRDTTLRDSLPLAAFVGQALLPDEETALQQVGYLPVDAATQQANEALWLEVVGE